MGNTAKRRPASVILLMEFEPVHAVAEARKRGVVHEKGNDSGGIDGGERRGTRVHDNGKNTGVPRDEWQHIHAPPEFKKSIAQVIHPGAVIVVTPESLHQGSTGMRLTVIDTEKGKKG